MPVGGLDPDEEGGLLAACGAGLVDAGAGDGADPRPVADRLGELGKLRERFEVMLAQFVTGRENVGVGCGPAGSFEETLCGGVEVVLPRREEPRVPPLGDRGSCRGPGLEDQERQAALREVGSGGKADLWSVDLTGVNARRIPTPLDGSDPSWGPLRP